MIGLAQVLQLALSRDSMSVCVEGGWGVGAYLHPAQWAKNMGRWFFSVVGKQTLYCMSVISKPIKQAIINYSFIRSESHSFH